VTDLDAVLAAERAIAGAKLELRLSKETLDDEKRIAHRRAMDAHARIGANALLRLLSGEP
jgi:hypothetical protein